MASQFYRKQFIYSKHEFDLKTRTRTRFYDSASEAGIYIIFLKRNPDSRLHGNDFANGLGGLIEDF